jgi:hypothetical protein
VQHVTIPCCCQELLKLMRHFLKTFDVSQAPRHTHVLPVFHSTLSLPSLTWQRFPPNRCQSYVVTSCSPEESNLGCDAAVFQRIAVPSSSWSVKLPLVSAVYASCTTWLRQIKTMRSLDTQAAPNPSQRHSPDSLHL